MHARLQGVVSKKISNGKAIFCKPGPNSHCQKLCKPCRAAVNNAPRFWLNLRKGEKEKGGLNINGVGEGELPGGGH